MIFLSSVTIVFFPVFSYNNPMINRLILRGRQFVSTQPDTFNYGIDGLLVMGALSIAANNNNLFAQRLGATDFQLTHLQLFPHLLALFLLIPAGLLVGSLRNKRKVISLMLLLTGIFFAVISVSAFMPGNQVLFFVIFFALASVSVNGMYNVTWQAYFPEVVQEEKRNTVLTFRTRMTMFIALGVPLAVGVILTSIPSMSGKIAAHQIFYAVAAVLLIVNAFHFRKIKATAPAESKRVSFAEIKIAARRLKGNKPFIIFTLAMLFFHMTWQIDWTIAFICQSTYLQMNELALTMVPVSGVIAQLLTLKFWSKNNAKKGVDQPVVYAILGLAVLPLGFIAAMNMSHMPGIILFLAVHFITQLTIVNIVLNLFQCLLKVSDEEYRSFSISIYISIMTLSNAIMPRVGVWIYHQLGANAQALQMTFAGVVVLRLLAAGVWMLRVKFMKKQLLDSGSSPE